MATVKIRIEGSAAAIAAVVQHLKATGNVTGETKLYPNRQGDESRFYAVLTVPKPTPPNQRATAAHQARQRAIDESDPIKRAYLAGLADGLEFDE